MAYNISSAPKNYRVYGWHQGHDAIETGKMFILIEYSYDLEKSNTQTFNVLDLVGSVVSRILRVSGSLGH